jgi:L-gulonate 3-dehydrogenase
VRDYAERYQSIYSNIFPSVQRRVDWTGPVMDAVERDRGQKLGRDKLGERQVWRDRRLMALLAHKRQAGHDIGD